jgi:hypothetical protein
MLRKFSLKTFFALFFDYFVKVGLNCFQIIYEFSVNYCMIVFYYCLCTFLSIEYLNLKYLARYLHGYSHLEGVQYLANGLKKTMVTSYVF